MSTLNLSDLEKLSTVPKHAERHIAFMRCIVRDLLENFGHRVICRADTRKVVTTMFKVLQSFSVAVNTGVRAYKPSGITVWRFSV